MTMKTAKERTGVESPAVEALNWVGIVSDPLAKLRRIASTLNRFPNGSQKVHNHQMLITTSPPLVSIVFRLWMLRMQIQDRI